MIKEFLIKNILDPYLMYKGKRLQRKISRAETKAKTEYFRSKEYREKLSEELFRENSSSNIREVDIKKRVKKPEIDASEEELLETYGSGVWIYSACNAIAEKSASVEPQLVDQDEEIQNSDEILNRIQKPNSLMSRFDLFELTQLWLDLSGNAYWHVPKDKNIILPLRPTKVAVIPEKENGDIIGYAYNTKGGFDRRIKNNGIHIKNRIDYDDFIRSIKTNKGFEDQKIKMIKQEEWIPFEKDEIIHFKYQHPYNSYYGMSPLQPLLLSLESELYARGWNKRFFENGAIPLGIMIVPDIIDPVDFKNMREKWEKEHQGSGKEHKIAWMNREIEYKELESNPKDVEFLNLIRMTREDTLAVLNVPPVMVGVYTFENSSSRSAGVREQRQIFWQDCVIPKLKKIYDQLNLFFYPEGDFFLRPDLTNIDALQPEWTEVAKGAREALLGGLSVEEVRELFWKRTNDPPGPIYLPATVLPTNIDQENQTEGYELVNTSKKKLNDPVRTQLWKSFIDQIEPIEEKIFQWLKDLFSDQEKRILKELNELWQRGIDQNIQKAQQDIGDLFDLNSEVEEFQLEAMEMYTNLVSERGKEIFDQLEVGLTFNISDLNVQRALEQLTFTFADHVNRTTKEQLRQQLSEAISEGESIYKIRKRVEKVFDGTVRATAPRARMIARTETISIANGGSRLAYDQSGLVQQKEWLSSRDNRVRPSHVQADGQIRDLKQPFSVGGFLFDYPGDPQAPPQERINCRCTILPILVEKTDENPYGRYKDFENTIFGDIDDPEKFIGSLEEKVDHLLRSLIEKKQPLLAIEGKSGSPEEVEETQDRITALATKLKERGHNEFADFITESAQFSYLMGSAGFYKENLGIVILKKIGKIPKVRRILQIPDNTFSISGYFRENVGDDAGSLSTTIHELGHFMDFAIQDRFKEIIEPIKEKVYKETSTKYGYDTIESLIDGENKFKSNRILSIANNKIKKEVDKTPEGKWVKSMWRKRSKHITEYQEAPGEGSSEALATYVFANNWMKKNHRTDWNLIKKAEEILDISITPVE